MERDKSRMEHVEWWAKYVKGHPKEWRSQTVPFVNAQIEMANNFYDRLEKMPGGAEKIRKLRSINGLRRRPTRWT